MLIHFYLVLRSIIFVICLVLNQYKETEENNRMGKTRDLFKKIRDTKGIFHAKMGTIKDKNGMDLREAEDEEVARINRRTIQKRS